MGDAVTSQTFVDGPVNCRMVFLNISDGSGENLVRKVDVSALSGSPSSVAITRIDYSMAGIGLDIWWDADTNVLAHHIPQDQSGTLDFSEFAGLQNTAGAGKTGDILFSTNNNALDGDRYFVTLYLRKKYG